MLIDNSPINHTALHNKVAIITGAGQGIGRQTALILAHLSVAVVIAEINDTTGKATEGTINEHGG
jgi:NAD(P)-dependent dehydrogenase (short-subunit alcohol dehydrogenase family)